MVIRCTGFRPALAPLAPLQLRDRHGRIANDGTRAISEPRLHPLGYGDGTGAASAPLIAVGQTARNAAQQIRDLLR
ncbi:hypothetical protein HUF15_31840 [Streptomyces samsunensis]|nr:hypothetical protein [Streptomyces samsunensis]